ncbi:MAG: class I SAM-dependent methyltransferase [Clostridiales bacterium]|nr:class I SAM-dependent methyltransferase [Clostridiales bacterium]
MNNISKTLYIPLYGKAYVSQRGIILNDPKAEAIWAAEGFALQGKAKSKWLAYSMAMRAVAFDRWAAQQMEENPDALVLHIGCGMDSRAERVGQCNGCQWVDIDFSDVIEERKRYYTESETYRMLPGDATETGWLETLPQAKTAIVVMEGISMYLKPEALTSLLAALKGRFAKLHLLMDCYTTFGAKASKYKNPINTVGVTMTYGIDDPAQLAEAAGIEYVQEHNMAPEDLIMHLKGLEKTFFRKLFAGKFARKIYRMYAFTAQTASNPEAIVRRAAEDLATLERLGDAIQYLSDLAKQQDGFEGINSMLYRYGDYLFNVGIRFAMEAHASGLKVANSWGIASAPEWIAYIRLTNNKHCVLITRVQGVRESMPLPCSGVDWSHVSPAGAQQLIADAETLQDHKTINDALLSTQTWHVIPSNGRIVISDWSQLHPLASDKQGQEMVENVKMELADRGLI